ncbi:MAG: hypothetical protein QM703_29695 [Gemmatales bacterium]
MIEHFIDFAPLSRRLFGGIARLTSTWLHPLSEGDPTQKVLQGLLTTAILLTGALFLKWLLTWFMYRNRIFIRV